MFFKLKEHIIKNSAVLLEVKIMELPNMHFIQHPVRSTPVQVLQNIHVSILFSNTLNLYSCFSVRDRVSNLHKKRAKLHSILYFNLHAFR